MERYFDKGQALPTEKGGLGALFEDSRGRLWLSVGNVLTWRENQRFHEVPSFRLHLSYRVRCISEDVQGNWPQSVANFPKLVVYFGDCLYSQLPSQSRL
jgi:hypothetical protein